jgi:hypothetical protein
VGGWILRVAVWNALDWMRLAQVRDKRWAVVNVRRLVSHASPISVPALCWFVSLCPHGDM